MIFRKFGSMMPSGPRKRIITAICLAVSIAGQASMKATAPEAEPLTAMKVFAEVPLEVLDMLRTSSRLDMIDYYTQADSLLTVTNALGGESRLLEVAPDYLKVSVSPVSTLEIKILDGGKAPVVMTLYTVGGEDMARDTEVRFFDSGLRPLDPSKLMKAPGLTDFFTLKGSGVSEQELKGKVSYAAVEYTTGPGNVPLIAMLTTLKALSQEDRDLLDPLLSPALSAPWKGSYRFR